jgi:hypothetical protein
VPKHLTIAVPRDAVLAFNFETQCCRRRNALGPRRRAHISGSGGRRRCSPAARRLGVSKSIVSRRLARVEKALGNQLLHGRTAIRGMTAAISADSRPTSPLGEPRSSPEGKMIICKEITDSTCEHAHVPKVNVLRESTTSQLWAASGIRVPARRTAAPRRILTSART